ncbi:MAG: hypothetical protein HRT47_13290 [Candidatus Caenarcaniphilales bacterium]|nr:hypothetical protein [Candidatus Caenarcaniphilales bacterium]
MTTEHPYSQREMDIIIQNLTKDFTLAIHKLDAKIESKFDHLDSKIDTVEVKLDGRIDGIEKSFKVELNYLKILNTGIFIAIISSWIALYLQNR